MNVDPNDFISKSRCKLSYRLFLINPTKAIRQLLGQDIHIISYVLNDAVFDDETCVVDVEYLSIKLSPYRIYFINKDDIKQLTPESHVYIASVNGCNVKIVSPIIKDFKNVIPLIINSSVTNNYSPAGPLDMSFSYFGILARKGLNAYCTSNTHIGQKNVSFMVEDIKPIYPDNYVCSHVMNDAETIAAYKSEVSQQSILNIIDNVVMVKKFDECKLGTIGYVMDYNALPKNEDINGIILIQPKRKPNLLLYYPIVNFTITSDEITSIIRFMQMDSINNTNYDYCINVLNK